MNAVSVIFKEKGKEYIFYDNNIELQENDYVLVETERGMQFGKVARCNIDTNKDHSVVIKKASEKDYKINEKNLKDAEKAIKKAKDIAEELNLDMKFIDSYFTFDRKQLIFHFYAENRVDFRELAKNLASIYKTRIELRQLGARDKAKEVSGVGMCGRKMCCSCFLKDLDTVGISMVKNQNLAPNPNKINGQCGRLLCCLKYEDELYTNNRRQIPNIGDKYKEENFEGSVISIDIPQLKFVVLNDEGEKKVIEVEKCEKCSKRKNCNK